MKVNKIQYLVVVGMVTVLGWLGVSSRNAYADSNSMTVSPPYQKMILVPGEVYNGSLSVSNSANSTRDLKYKVAVGSFSQRKNEESGDDYGSMDHISVSSYNQIMEWIELHDEGGTIAPGEKKVITYSIYVPEDAPGGGQYATIRIIDETTSGLGGTGNISIDQRFQFASIIYAEVAGETREEGEVTDNSIPSFLLQSPLIASSMVKNDGNVHTDAEYILQVWPMFSDEEICTNEEEPMTSLILPETERYHTQTCDLPSIGIFRAKQTVKIYGKTSITERVVVICPLWLLFVILLAIASVIIYIVIKIRARRAG